MALWGFGAGGAGACRAARSLFGATGVIARVRVATAVVFARVRVVVAVVVFSNAEIPV